MRRSNENIFFLFAAAISVIILFFFSTQFAIEQDTSLILKSPSWTLPFGTDSLGRNYFWRVASGLCNSLWIAGLVAFLSLVICLIFSFFILLKNKYINTIIQKVADYLDIFPHFIVLSLILSWMHSDSLFYLVVGMASVNWMSSYRVLKGVIATTMTQDHYLASVAMGGSNSHLFRQHILPELRENLKTLFILSMSSAIITEGGISVLGLGVKAPQTSLGLLFYESWSQMDAFPWLILIPTLVYLGLILLLARLKKKASRFDEYSPSVNKT